MANPTFSRAFPIFESTDLERALWFYRDLLGWQQTYRFPPEESESAQYVSLDLGPSHIGIGAGASSASPPPRHQGTFTLCVYTPDTDAAVEFLRGQGVTVTEEPADMPWGERVAYVLDPDGNAVMICSESP